MFKLVSLKTIGFKRLYIPESINFPEGRILIYGVNESGKSTLLEAIHYALFGMGLRPNRRASNEDLINYNYSEALIELVFSIDEKKYHVRRVLKKTSVNEHQINEVLPNGTISELTSGANNVNDHIQDILHGIDSDALLNSCLVEQKELGKLEDSSRQERIKAMSSLLNLEAFLDAKNEIKKDRNELEQVHNDTKIKLQKAEQATIKYKEAEEKYQEARKKLKDIKSQQDEIVKEIKKLEELLSVLDKMKKLTSRIEESKARTEGLEETRKQLETQLAQVVKSEKELEKIEKQLPEERKKLTKAREELEIIKELVELEKGREDLRNQIEKISLRIEEASRQLEEAHEAKRQIKELENRIKEYIPAKKAYEQISDFSKKAQQYQKNEEDIKQLKESNKEIQNRLTSLKNSEEKINSLEKKEKRLQKEKRTFQNRRSIGLVMAGFGIMALIFTLMNWILILPIIGLLTLASGGYLYTQSDPSKTDHELHKIRDEREKLLGQISRIKEYKTQLSENQKEIEEKLNMKQEFEVTLYKSLESLPQKPANYASFIEIENLEKSLNITQEKIQSDIQNLTKLETMKSTLSETAIKLEERKSNFEEQEKKLRQLLEKQNKINQEIDRKEEKTGLNLEKEGEIKGKYEKLQNMVTTLTTRRESAIEAIKRKPGYERSLKKTVEQIDKMENIIQESEKKLSSLVKEVSIDLKDESKIRNRYETNLKTISRLDTEEKERQNDIKEATEVMKSTEDLKKEYPQIQEDNNREEFRLESMRRAMVLLDTTRDSIMSGVKQNVEKHMMHFLPVLTDQRYNMARIDETDYRIEVYDREAKQWRGKGVFSGATQDQFSLALRLAFAISTIPGSRGARPGFIFLDEPLSGFDTRRREGFMKLLQEELNQYFVQIIVISHLEILRNDFQHQMEIEAGKIVN